MGKFYQYAGAQEKGETKPGEIFTYLTENTTAHGITHVAKAHGGCKKAYWSVLSLCFIAALSYNIYTITDLYFSYPVKVVISLQHEEELDFPAVSICNMSPVRRSLWEQYLNETAFEQSSENSPVSQPTKSRRKRSTGDRSCPSGWTVADDSCIIAGSSSESWSGAQLECEHLLGNLATIDTATVNAAAGALVSSSKYWMGLSTDWGFSDNTALGSWEVWRSGDPNEETGCIRLADYSRQWTDKPCTSYYNIVCSTDDTAACTGAGTWLYSGTRCYYADTAIFSQWADGDSRCDSFYSGATLAKIDSQAEHTYVENNVINGVSWRSFWFGLRYVYLWKDGTSVSYMNWQPGSPSDFPGCGGIMTGLNTWQTADCSDSYKYICQKATPCVSTGTSCIDITDCSSTANGNYQSCEGCDHYIACTSGIGSYTKCPGSLVWNDNTGACDWTSPTCDECAVSPTTIADTTLGMYTTQPDTTMNVPDTTVPVIVTTNPPVTTRLPDTSLVVDTTQAQATTQPDTTRLPDTSLVVDTTQAQATTQPDTTLNIPDTTVPAIITTNPPDTTRSIDTTQAQATTHVLPSTQIMDTTDTLSTTQDFHTTHVVASTEKDTSTCSCCCGNQYIYEQNPSAENQTTSALSSEPQYVEESQFEDKPVLREDFRKGEEIIETLGDIEPIPRAGLGFSLSDLILDCQFEGSDCTSSDFDTFANPIYGNCYTFNSGWHSDVKLSKQSGRRYGLHLTLNVNQDEYIGDFEDTAGMRVVIHQGSRMPFPEDEGITVAPGMTSFLAMKQVSIARLGNPFGDCVDPEASNAEINAYEEQYPVNYSITACQRTCLQKAIIETCNCADSYYPREGMAFNNKSVPICSSSNLTQDDCKFGVKKSFENNELSCDCPNPCLNTIYSLDISTGQWPSDVQRDTLLNRYASQIPDLLNDPSDPSKYARNLMKVEIYYKEFNYENMSEMPSYLGGNYASDLGGVLGLWFGLSLLTLFEFIEFLLDMCILGFSKCCRTKSKSNVRDLGPRDTRYSLGDLELTSQSLLHLRGIYSRGQQSRDPSRESKRGSSGESRRGSVSGSTRGSGRASTHHRGKGGSKAKQWSAGVRGHRLSHIPEESSRRPSLISLSNPSTTYPYNSPPPPYRSTASSGTSSRSTHSSTASSGGSPRSKQSSISSSVESPASTYNSSTPRSSIESPRFGYSSTMGSRRSKRSPHSSTSRSSGGIKSGYGSTTSSVGGQRSSQRSATSFNDGQRSRHSSTARSDETLPRGGVVNNDVSLPPEYTSPRPDSNFDVVDWY